MSDEFVVVRLLKLQECDMRLKDLETRLEILPKEMNKIIAQRDKINASTAEAVNTVKKIRIRIKKEEDLIQELKNSSEKLRQQSALVKKNNEYQAMLASIQMNENQIGEAEERILIAHDDLEKARKAGAKLKFANDAEIKNLRAEFEELFEFSKVVKEEIAKLKESRPGLTADIPSNMLSAYESLLGGKKGGSPLVTAANDICGYCQLKITAQTSALLKQGGIVFCDNCQHMLYSPEFL